MRSAVVLGGSVAGLITARVLSDHAEEVVVLEPDGLIDEGAGRGAPHRHQLHALLAMGHTQIERWFPGITRELVHGGAHLGTGTAIQYYVDGVLRPNVPDAHMLGATRPFVEDHLRRRVLALPNVTITTARARDLIFSGTRVSGVRFSSTADNSPSPDPDGELEADLVVDAMGRSSRLGKWLLKHGWEQAPFERMTVDLGYATAHFRRGDELPETVVAHASPGPASGYQYREAVTEPAAVTALEGNRWGVVLAGYTDYRPGCDPDEFKARMRRSVAPIREIAEKCELDSPIGTFHFRESLRRDFTGLSRFPGGLIAVGDAVASVNPIYGQGLTVAALQASALSAYLRTGASPHAAAWGYFRRAGVIVNAAWQLSATADLAQHHVAGHRPRGYRLTRWVGDKITEASVIDPVVNQAFMDVVHMRKRPKALSHPSVLLATALALSSRALKRTPSEAHQTVWDADGQTKTGSEAGNRGASR
ncbi:hypothetical protein OHA61_01045 [Streptomyces sp. NBC_00885]|uniref:NAD(P)/FAD-dependent oxidoreductase n=1 Tax=Streptomyces sp. NBC_00885 TaxID=2975857 RepID=UPI00386ACEFB|nr:hypothetical protein OHA61_01045 [Streptomyces sp. NBC_00885]